jgi:hypothetical protein
MKNRKLRFAYRTVALGGLVAVTACSANSGGGSPAGGGGSGNVNSGNGGALQESGGTSNASGGIIGNDTGGSGLISPDPNQGSCSDQTVSVLFVIDRSGSMNCNLPPITDSAACETMSPPAKVDTTQPSKWEVIDHTLSTAFDLLVPKDPSVHVRAGLTYFSVDGVCGSMTAPAVPVADVTQAQLDQMRVSVGTQKPAGGTPIVGAVMHGYNYLYETLQVTGNAHVVLITDGSDSCGDYYSADPRIGPGDHVADLINTKAPAAVGVGIKTWVIGAPGSEPARYMLSNLAIAGGTRRTPDCNPGTSGDPTSGDCHYDMTQGDFQTALQTALDHIMAVVTCQPIM